MGVENLLARAADHFSVRRAFGAAYEKDGMLIIPVAIVAGGGGGGSSGNRLSHPAAVSPQETGFPSSDATSQDFGRTDVGGGFGGLVLPTGAYVVRGDSVRWVPALDVTIVVLASLGLVRMLARTWTSAQKRHDGYDPPPDTGQA